MLLSITKDVCNCHECPFCNNDNEFGKDSCNLADMMGVEYKIEELPSDSVPKFCPLRYQSVLVKLTDRAKSSD